MRRKEKEKDEKEKPPNEFSSTHCRFHLAPFYMTAMHIVTLRPSHTAFKRSVYRAEHRNLLMMLNRREADPAKDKSLLSA